MHRSQRIALTVAALLAAAPRAGAECRPPRPGARLRLSLAPRSPLADVARWLSATICKPVVYGAGVDPATRITIVAESELPAAAVYGLFVDALAAIDLRAVRGKQSIIVKPSAACAAFARRHRPSPLPPSSRRTPAPLGVDAEALERGIRRRTATEYDVRRSVLDAVLADARWMMSSVRIVPHLHEGKSDGFKLFAIRPGSFWDRLGFKNGDTVHDLDGTPLTSPETALQAYTRIRGAKRITVRVTRRGTPLTLSYRIGR